MMRTWLFLALAGGLLQAMLAARVRNQAVGFLIPAAFAGFAGYACTSLSRVGIDFPVRFCFWLPSVVQLLVQAVWARSAKRWQGVILPVVYELFFARQTLGALHYSSTGPRYLPDYYLFSMLFVSGIALALVFYAAWYAWRCRQ